MKSKQLDFHDERQDLAAYQHYIRNNRHPIALLLDQVNNVQNIGAIFRLADAARLEKVYAYSYNEQISEKKLKRIARAANEFVPFERLQTPEAIAGLKEKYELVALEITNTSIPYTQFSPQKPCLLIVGNEQNGVSPDLLRLAEHSIHIPMFGINTSMNVAMSVGIAAYGLLHNLGIE